MSFLVIDWAETAPLADVYERAIITCMAHKASSDGTGCWRSIKTMAEFAMCDEKTIERHLRNLRNRGVIAYGDQRLTKHLPRDKRPKVYDLLVPYNWYSSDQMAKVDEERLQRGLAPLEPGSRPALAQPERRGRRARSDKGVPRSATPSGAVAPSPTPTRPPAGGLIDPPPGKAAQAPQTPAGGSDSPPAGGLVVPPPGVLETPNTVHLPTGGNRPNQSVPGGHAAAPQAPADRKKADHSGLVVTTEDKSVVTTTTRGRKLVSIRDETVRQTLTAAPSDTEMPPAAPSPRGGPSPTHPPETPPAAGSRRRTPPLRRPAP